MFDKQSLDQFRKLLNEASKICVIQAQNPDADSLGSAIALESLLAEQGKEVSLHCASEMPKYIRYIDGWDRVSTDMDKSADLYMIVDTSSKSLLETSLETFDFTQKPLVILDHHASENDFQNEAVNLIIEDLSSTGELVYLLWDELNMPISKNAAAPILYAILGDTLGLISPSTTWKTVFIVSQIVKNHDISLNSLDKKRRVLGRKPLEIVKYKGELLQRIEYYFDNKLAIITVPLEEIKAHSDAYNPTVLALEELRQAEEVRIAIGLKLYEDRITAKLSEVQDAPICNKIAEEFGGGGHPFAAGFKVQGTDLEEIKKKLLKVTYKYLEQL